MNAVASSRNDSQAPRLLSLTQVARALGVSKRTIEREILRGNLKALSIAKRIRRVEASALAEYLATAAAAS